MPNKWKSSLVLVGHGSTLNPDSSEPTFQHADEIVRRRVFAEVQCSFWKEEPSLREVLRMVDGDDIYVVPNFISEGYFTETVIPRELLLVGHGTSLNEKSAEAAQSQAKAIRERECYAEVSEAYMEEAPFIADWRKI